MTENCTNESLRAKGKQPLVEDPIEDEKKESVIELVDLTEKLEEQAEFAHALLWVKQQRDAGRLPN